MDHFFGTIDGHFNYTDVYRMMVEESPEEAHFVEIGAYLGKSTAHLAVEIINSGKNIKLDVIDTWRGNDSSEYQEGQWGYHLTIDNDTYDKFIENMSPVAGHYKAIQMDSVEASKLYEDGSLDFVFIDGAHDYKYVRADIDAWLPKVKSGGYIGGHDYVAGQHEEVVRAVDEVFGDDKKVYNVTWLHKVG